MLFGGMLAHAPFVMGLLPGWQSPLKPSKMTHLARWPPVRRRQRNLHLGIGYVRPLCLLHRTGEVRLDWKF
ncbi:protein of unknown function [Bradyrhizobium vignae]|uniref:Uncharacterized protein n=1 Tax=Bradyrhizobium vignae TaxID=1549949 RepID=A0A2U3PUZ0_9BRAD|nr:protein of unknown function [Bradyrhizobium vignae]